MPVVQWVAHVLRATFWLAFNLAIVDRRCSCCRRTWAPSRARTSAMPACSCAAWPPSGCTSPPGPGWSGACSSARRKPAEKGKPTGAEVAKGTLGCLANLVPIPFRVRVRRPCSPTGRGPGSAATTCSIPPVPPPIGCLPDRSTRSNTPRLDPLGRWRHGPPKRRHGRSWSRPRRRQSRPARVRPCSAPTRPTLEKLKREGRRDPARRATPGAPGDPGRGRCRQCRRPSARPTPARMAPRRRVSRPGPAREDRVLGA